VLKAVLTVMRVWLDASVDGRRLDAVSYLAMRAGLKTENHPETCAIMKKRHAAVDSAHPRRILLAEGSSC
jgi:maltose alpha-D-glucosyltransferase/alpha-amylase